MSPASRDSAVCPRGGQDCPPVEHCGSRAISRSLVVIKPAGSQPQDGTHLARCGRRAPRQSPLLTWLLPCTSISQGNLHIPILSFSITIPYHRWGN